MSAGERSSQKAGVWRDWPYDHEVVGRFPDLQVQHHSYQWPDDRPHGQTDQNPVASKQIQLGQYSGRCWLVTLHDLIGLNLIHALVSPIDFSIESLVNVLEGCIRFLQVWTFLISTA